LANDVNVTLRKKKKRTLSSPSGGRQISKVKNNGAVKKRSRGGKEKNP